MVEKTSLDRRNTGIRLRKRDLAIRAMAVVGDDDPAAREQTRTDNDAVVTGNMHLVTDSTVITDNNKRVVAVSRKGRYGLEPERVPG